jgi:predicted transcriptional regulator of viral defense system
LDDVIGRLAGRQHGTVARFQLLALGVDRYAIQRRLDAGRLHLLHAGVYSVGHDALTRHGRWMAAVLAGGPDAVLSHRSAASLWRIRDSSGHAIDVTVAGRRRRKGIAFHRSHLPPDERTIAHGIPVTTAARTLLDLGTVLDRRGVERALNQAEVLRLTDITSLPELLDRYPRRRGSSNLRALVRDQLVSTQVIREELELRFLEFVKRVGLPPPETNALVEARGRRFEVDCLWRVERVIVELDGRSTHGTDAAFEIDRERDRFLQTARWKPSRVTWRHLHRKPAALERDLRLLLGREIDGC